MKIGKFLFVLLSALVLIACDDDDTPAPNNSGIVVNCEDGLQNGGEEAIDCGGMECIPCDDVSLCGDGIQNGYEDGVDCYNGTDGLSACPSCMALCNDGTMNGFENDTDCGGPDCAPCSNSDTGFMSYEVDGVLYESHFTSLVFERLPGLSSFPDVLRVQGGINHRLHFFIVDSDTVPGSFNTGVYNISSGSGNAADELEFIDNDGQTFFASTDANGLTVDINQIDYVDPMPGVEGGLVAFTFEGQVFDSNTQITKWIENGQASGRFTN